MTGMGDVGQGGGGNDEQPQKLDEVVTHLLEEGRMLLPGIQALFGFQLVAVFSTPFHDRLGDPERELHLLALGLVAVCMALVLAPAAYHRQAEPRSISDRFVTYSSRLLTIAMGVLMVALCMDFYLVSLLAGNEHSLSLLLALLLGGIFSSLWFVVPWCMCLIRRRRC